MQRTFRRASAKWLTVLSALLAPTMVLAQGYTGSYQGTLHSYCPSFDYTNNVVITIAADNSVSVRETSGQTEYDSTGTIAANGTIKGLSIQVYSLSRGNLTISYSAQVASGGTITGSGSSGDIDVDVKASFAVPAFFTGQTPLKKGVYYLALLGGNDFGYYAYLSNPAYIYHFDLGYEYVFDADDGEDGVYFYDFASSDFFYTSPTFPFPFLYDFNLQTVLYYYPDTKNAGRYTTNPRYFYDFATSQIITK